MDLRTYDIELPAVPELSPDGDPIVTQFFHHTVNGVMQPEQELAVDAMKVRVEVPQAASVDCVAEHQDDDGKRGPAKTQTFIAADDVGPDAPGDFGAITFIGERTVPDA
jgi:hypothetical protein